MFECVLNAGIISSNRPTGASLRLRGLDTENSGRTTHWLKPNPLTMLHWNADGQTGEGCRMPHHPACE